VKNEPSMARPNDLRERFEDIVPSEICYLDIGKAFMIRRKMSNQPPKTAISRLLIQ